MKKSINDIAINKKAYHDYFIEEELEAGLVLVGTEIKSVRSGKVQLKEAFISFEHMEAYVKAMHISQYKEANIFNHDETRIRKLLLHKREILKLYQAQKIDGYTIIPLKMYFKNGFAKLLIGLCKGKKLYDKRASDKEKTMKKEALKALRR